MSTYWTEIYVPENHIEEVKRVAESCGFKLWVTVASTEKMTEDNLKGITELLSDKQRKITKLRRICNDQQELIAKLRRRCAELREDAEDALETCEYEGYEGSLIPVDTWEFPEEGDPGDG